MAQPSRGIHHRRGDDAEKDGKSHDGSGRDAEPAHPARQAPSPPGYASRRHRRDESEKLPFREDIETLEARIEGSRPLDTGGHGEGEDREDGPGGDEDEDGRAHDITSRRR